MEENEADRIQGKLRDERKPVKMKKFYKEAKVEGLKAPFKVELDGRVMKTPLKSVLEIPSKALAKEIAAEWNAQDEFIETSAMFLTKYANIAVDQVAAGPEATVDEIVAYASSDLVCYRADTPQGLVDRQSAAWDPVLKWAEDKHKLNFICVAGIVYASQPVATLATTHDLLSKMNAHTLTVIHHLTTLMGSALLAMVMVEGAITADDAWNAAHLDEDWNIEQWGTDDDAIERRKVRRGEFDGILAFYRLVG